jgi:hypothetical protein
VPVRIESAGRSVPVRIYLPHGMCLELPDGLANLSAAMRALREAELC